MLATNTFPKYDMTDNPTGCCPRFDPVGWDEQVVELKDKLFVKGTTFSLFHIPLNMGRMMKRVWDRITATKAAEDNIVVLSWDPSPWKGEHLFSVNKEVVGEESVRLSGVFMTKVFDGRFKDVPKWLEETKRYVAGKGKTAGQIYFFYTTCPKCAKTYGHNYVVAFAEVTNGSTNRNVH